MNKKIMGALGLVSVALVGGTFAYFTQSSTIDNPFDTASYSTVITEDFKPEEGEDWKPGAEVNKDLYVDNTGDRDVVVRVKFEDIWSRTVDGVTKYLNFSEGNDATGILDSKVSVAEPGQLSPVDGLTQGDGSVVHKYFVEGWEQDWVYNQQDGYYYYKHNLSAAGQDGSTTGKFLDSVRLKSDVDMGKFMTQFYWTDATEKPVTSKVHEEMLKAGWQPYGDPQPAGRDEDGNIINASVTAKEGSSFTAAVTTPDKDALGYSDASYVLRITIETVQATDKAVVTTFGESLDAIMGELNWNLDSEDLEDKPSTMPQE